MGVISSLQFVDYVVEVLYAYPFLIFNINHLIFIGCALSAPDGSSPRGYVWQLVVKHRLKVQLLFLLWLPWC
jgi:hypothetical protein